MTRLGTELFDDEGIQDPYPLYRRRLATAPVHLNGDSGSTRCAVGMRLEAQIVIGRLLERTSMVEAAKTGRWLPSLLRRLERLELACE